MNILFLLIFSLLAGVWTHGTTSPKTQASESPTTSASMAKTSTAHSSARDPPSPTNNPPQAHSQGTNHVAMQKIARKQQPTPYGKTYLAASQQNVRKQHPTSSGNCCPALHLSSISVNDPVPSSCKKTCIDGITITGLDCNQNTPSSKNWLPHLNYLAQFEVVNGNFMMSSLRKCGFVFPELTKIKGSYVNIEDLELAVNTFPKLEIIEPTFNGCEIIASTSSLTGDTAFADRFKDAVDKGRQKCIAAQPPPPPPPATPPPPPTPAPTALNSPNQAALSNQTSDDCSAGEKFYGIPLLWMFYSISSTLVFTIVSGVALFFYCWYTRRNVKSSYMYAFLRVLDGCFRSPVSIVLGWVFNTPSECGNSQSDSTAETDETYSCIEATRVRGGLESDYINANYIAVPGNNKRFIATMAPHLTGAHNFWRMVKQQKTEHVISMMDNADLNKLDAPEKIYYPEKVGSTQTFKHRKNDQTVDVKCIKCKMITFGKGTKVRKTKVALKFPGEKEKAHTVTIWQWLDFPNHAAPMSEEGSLVEVLLQAMNSRYPIVVHGILGVGRTGIVAVVGYMLSQWIQGQVIDHPQVILQNLRKCRRRLVENGGQWLFALNVVFEYLHDFSGDLGGREGQYEEFKAACQEEVMKAQKLAPLVRKTTADDKKEDEEAEKERLEEMKERERLENEDKMREEQKKNEWRRKEEEGMKMKYAETKEKLEDAQGEAQMWRRKLEDKQRQEDLAELRRWLERKKAEGIVLWQEYNRNKPKLGCPKFPRYARNSDLMHKLRKEWHDADEENRLLTLMKEEKEEEKKEKKEKYLAKKEGRKTNVVKKEGRKKGAKNVVKKEGKKKEEAKDVEKKTDESKEDEQKKDEVKESEKKDKKHEGKEGEKKDKKDEGETDEKKKKEDPKEAVEEQKQQ